MSICDHFYLHGFVIIYSFISFKLMDWKKKTLKYESSFNECCSDKQPYKMMNP